MAYGAFLLHARAQGTSHAPALTIREIRARAVSLAPERPVETASGTLARTPLEPLRLYPPHDYTIASALRSRARSRATSFRAVASSSTSVR